MSSDIFKTLDSQYTIIREIVSLLNSQTKLIAGLYGDVMPEINSDELLKPPQNSPLKVLTDSKTEAPIKKKTEKKDIVIDKIKLKKIDVDKNRYLQDYLKKDRIRKTLINIVKNCPIVISSTQFPGYGGSATNCYNLHKFLIKLGFTNTHCIFFVHNKFCSKETFNYNPENIKNVTFFNRSKLNDDVKKNIINSLSGEPSVLLCKNYWSCNYLGGLFPNSCNVYLVSGSANMTNYIKKEEVTFNQVIKDEFCLEKLKSNNHAVEEKAISISDYILCNSINSNLIMKKTYPDHSNKIFNLFTTYISSFVGMCNYNIKENNERYYDLAYIVSNFTRTIKGPSLVCKLLHKLNKTPVKKILIVGDENKELIFPKFEGIEYTITNKIENKNVLKALYNTKLLIMPSLYEACPNIIHEASIMGANVILSKNVGSWEVFSEKSAINNYNDVDEWIDKITHLLNNKYILKNDHIENAADKFLKLIYEANIKNKNAKDIVFNNYIYLDYDILKIYNDTILIDSYEYLLPESLMYLFTKEFNSKYDAQINKMINKLGQIDAKHISQFTGKDYLAFLSTQSDYIVFTNRKIKSVKHYFPKGDITDKFTAILSSKKNNLILNISLPNTGLEDIQKVLSDIKESTDFQTISIISSLNKPI